jgi:hypothetical protein
MGEMLFHGKAANVAALSAITISKVRARSVETEEFVLDMD